MKIEKNNISVLEIKQVLHENNLDYILTANMDTVLPYPVAWSEFKGEGLTFCIDLDKNKFLSFQDSNNSLIIISKKLRDAIKQGPFLFVDDPKHAFILTARLFQPKLTIGIHPSAIIDPNAKIGRNVCIGPLCSIGAAKIGDNVQLGANVTISEHVRIDDRVTIMSGAHLGDPGVNRTIAADGKPIGFPHFDKLIINEDVVIGSGTVLMQGILNPTVIGKGCAISSNCVIGHNARLGKYVYMSIGVLVGGHVTIGDNSFIGLGACLKDNINIAERVTVGMNTTVTRSCDSPGMTLIAPQPKNIGEFFSKI